ncbi:retrovirus-related pol polyprotein from transposon TNT 1-94 [Tanacetum coccineum]
MVGLSFRMFKNDRIRIRGILLGEMVLHKIEMGMPMQDKMLLMQAQENGAVLDEEELLFLAGEQANTFDADVDNQPVQDLALNEDNIFQADECDAFDSDVDDEPTAQSIFMANLSSCRLHKSNTSCSIKLHQSYLRQAKKAQPALYDGEELLKTHHVPVIVPSSEEDLELAETTRNKLHAKMNDSACVEKRVNITPPNYSKENFMATFTPQTQLTPEQVFWSIDLEKRKAEELKANAPPLPVLPPATVYPPNTPVHLVPRTLPTTSQVNIGLYVITQLFWDFEKTCKKRITPTGITEGERGFEQTKRCYLTEVIPFFNLLKEHFDGVQKSLVTEVRAMKAVFENLEAEVDQNEIDLKSGEIERKNLLITNENLIAECLSKDVFYTATDSVLNVSRFSDMHDAFTIAQKRIADLESENFNLRNKIQNDDHDSMIKHFSKLEVEHFNLQLKYQNLKERFGNKKPVTSSDAPSFDSLFVIGKLNEQIQISQNKDLTAKLNALHDLNERFRAENAKVKQHYKELYPIDVEPIPPRHKNNREVHLHYIKHLKENVETLREIVEDAKVERSLDTSLASTCRYTKHSQELLEYWRPTGRLLPLGDQWPLTRNTPHKVLPIKQWKPTSRLLPLGRQCPLVRSTALKSDCMPADPQETIAPVVQIILWYLDSGCSKHMTGDRSRLRNFMKKFIGTVRFGNDHFGAIMGYGDYVIGDSVISRVYYVEGLGHNLFSVGQFCDSDLEVAFRKHTCFVRDLDGVDLIKGSRGTNLYTISVEDMMRSSPICLLSRASKNKSWLWHRRLNHLNFGTLNDLARKDLVRGLPRLKFEKDHLCSACQLGKSRKATHKPKTINTIIEVLHTLHMDLYGPLRVQGIIRKKYILVIVDDYSRFTWVKFLRTKDETPAFVINLLKQLQVGLNKTVRFVRTDNGTEFVNKALTDYYESVGITHEKTVLRTPQQNGVVKRRNRTLVEAAWTMLIFSKALLFLWAEVVATAYRTGQPSLCRSICDSDLERSSFGEPGNETPAFVINLLKQLQVGLNKTVRASAITYERPCLRTTSAEWRWLNVKGIATPSVEAAQTMLIFSKAPCFLWSKMQWQSALLLSITQNLDLPTTQILLHTNHPYRKEDTDSTEHMEPTNHGNIHVTLRIRLDTEQTALVQL